MLYGRAAFLAQSASIFLSISVIALAIDVPHGFENASVFIDLIHVHQYRGARSLRARKLLSGWLPERSFLDRS